MRRGGDGVVFTPRTIGTVVCGLAALAGLLSLWATLNVGSRGSRDQQSDGADGGGINELFAESLPGHLKEVQTLYVIPGGGSGAGVEGVDKNYPEWTRRRVIAAHDHSKKNPPGNHKHALFLALSAGSLNTPNALREDGRVKFECQHTMEHLAELGVPRYAILGDFMSWDTITNALYLRMVISGLLAAQKTAQPQLKGSAARTKPLDVQVFISDFHADRVQAAFNWVLGLRPSILPLVQVTVNKVSSEGISWPNKESFESRLAHEVKGVEQIKANERMIRSVQELYAFLALGPHQGFFKYLQGELPGKKGQGW